MHGFMTKELGWTTVQARTSKDSVLYLMREPKRNPHYVTLTMKPDGSYDVTLDDETRTIPDRVTLGDLLGLNRTATITEQGSLLDQVLAKLVRKHRTVSQADIEDLMARFARGHL